MDSTVGEGQISATGVFAAENNIVQEHFRCVVWTMGIKLVVTIFVQFSINGPAHVLASIDLHILV